MRAKTKQQKKSDYLTEQLARPDDGCHETTLQWHVGSGNGNGDGWGGI